MFETLLIAMETYLGTLYKELGTILLNQEHEMIVLLCDEYLLGLPLEAMSIFQSRGIKSLSRDFSLQMFYYRFKLREVGGTYIFHISRNFSV